MPASFSPAGSSSPPAGVYCDYVQVSCIHPLQPGDENYAFNVAIPADDPGLRFYARRPFALGATNAFDYPLSSRFDEADCFVVLDNCFVPWERVFIYPRHRAHARPMVEDALTCLRQPPGPGALRDEAALPPGPCQAHE